MIRVAVTIAGGDRDCSSAVCTCGEAAGVIPPATYMWTGNERGILAGAGFARVDKRAAGRGDVAWRVGHTEIVLGRGMVGGARIDEVGGTHGPAPGDQTGREFAMGPWDPGAWDECWRYVGPATVAGIPVNEVMAQVMEHMIAHDESHGYSQDHRDGDGTRETVWIAWAGTPGPEPLVEDGWLGATSVARWQGEVGTTPDGEIWGQWSPNRWRYPAITCPIRYDAGTGSALVRAVQRRIGLEPDGVIGYWTVGTLQEWLDRRGHYIGAAGVDHVLGNATARAVQESINAGEWAA